MTPQYALNYFYDDVDTSFYCITRGGIIYTYGVRKLIFITAVAIIIT